MSDEDIANTRFDFKHKVFSLEGSHFSLSPTRQPTFTLPMGEHMVSVQLDRVCVEFGIEPDSNDGTLLGIVRKALKIVKIIKPGDALPNELLDGTASWTFEPRLRQKTKNKIVDAILRWNQGNNTAFVDDVSETQNSGSEKAADIAFEALAREIKITGSQPGKRVAEMVERLSDELTYIEAIGERLAEISLIRKQIRGLMDAARQDQEFGQELIRIDDLIGEPLKKLSTQIKKARDATFDVLPCFSNLDEHIGSLRGKRDQMRYELLDWDTYLDQWKETRDDPDIPVSVDLCRRTYRMLAEQYSQGQTWSAVG